MRTYCRAQGTLLNALWWPKWEEVQEGRGIGIYGADSLCYNSGNRHNIVKQLYSNKVDFKKKCHWQNSYCLGAAKSGNRISTWGEGYGPPFHWAREPPSLESSPGSFHPLCTKLGGCNISVSLRPALKCVPGLFLNYLVITAGPVVEMVGTDDLKSCLKPPPSLPQLWRGRSGVRMVWSWWRVEKGRQGETWGFLTTEGRGHS